MIQKSIDTNGIFVKNVVSKAKSVMERELLYRCVRPLGKGNRQ